MYQCPCIFHHSLILGDAERSKRVDCQLVSWRLPSHIVLRAVDLYGVHIYKLALRGGSVQAKSLHAIVVSRRNSLHINVP